MRWTNRIAVAICFLLFSHCAIAQHAPTPAQREGIDRDNARHFGDDPDDGGPLATHLSASLKPKAVEAVIRKVGDWELTRSAPYFNNEWTWSTLYIGFLAASDATGDPKYRDAVAAYAEKMGWRLRSHLPNADDQSLGQAYLDLYFLKPDPAKITPTREELDALLAAPEDPNRIPWWWCDALFMAPPLWVRMSKATGDEEYLDYMERQRAKTSALLYDENEHLYFRDATYLNKTESNGKKMFWSRGEGWVMAGLVRVLEVLPANDPNRDKYVTQFKEMAAKVASLQGKDGLWRAGLLDPDYYGLPENSGSAFFTYALAWGVNEGILDAKTYRPVIAKAWEGLLSQANAEGRLCSVRQTGAEPQFYKPTASSLTHPDLQRISLD
ncbi:MAG: glycoside hydrolase family 105 protein [Candidatus Acidiferrales bacterium]